MRSVLAMGSVLAVRVLVSSDLDPAKCKQMVQDGTDRDPVYAREPSQVASMAVDETATCRITAQYAVRQSTPPSVAYVHPSPHLPARPEPAGSVESGSRWS